MRVPLKGWNRLSQKFIAGVVLILLFTLAGTLFVNSQVAERFYLHEQREYLRRISARLEELLADGAVPEEAVEAMESTEKVLIAYSHQTSDPDELASELRDALKQKGLGFHRFWLWDQDYESAVQNGSQFRMYSQEKMNYSILVQYLSLDSGLYAVAAIVPDAQGFIAIVNRLGLLMNSLAILTAILLIIILTRHITNPLDKIREFTKRIAAQDYQPLQIKTGDELEDVANSLNEMAREVEEYQRILEEKNDQMKQLLGDVAHDLKTPIALVGVYASGMKDGLDDGTFLDTVIRQNDKMSRIVEKLLHLSRMERQEHVCRDLALDRVLLSCIREQEVLFAQRGLELCQRIEPGLMLHGNEELLGELFSNLLSNAAKYASSGCVTTELYRQDGGCVFRISNHTDHTDLDTDAIWNPFYVGENSRNKELSGTGLGLAIVKKIAEQFHYPVSCMRDGQEISFEVEFPETFFPGKEV